MPVDDGGPRPDVEVDAMNPEDKNFELPALRLRSKSALRDESWGVSVSSSVSYSYGSS